MGRGGCNKTPDPITTNSLPTRAPTTSLSWSNTTIPISLLEKKCTINECWIVYEGIVYDVTFWLRKHPGGMRSIMSAAGRDATCVMRSLHCPETLKNSMRMIKKVGRIEENAEIDVNVVDSKKRSRNIEEEFESLNEKLVREGWYVNTPFDYWATAIRASILLLLTVTLVPWGGGKWRFDESADETRGAYLESWMALIVGSACLGFFFQTIAFVGHDAGHGSITGNLDIDYKIGLVVGNTLTGISLSWWKSTHYVHHSATNSVHDDPDIQHMPLLCFEERMAENKWSTYHGWFMPFLGDIGRAIIQYQHLYFYPVMMVARFNLYAQSIIYLVQTCPFVPDNKKGEVVNDRTGEIREPYAWPKASKFLWIMEVVTLTLYYTMAIYLITSLDLVSATFFVLFSHFVAGVLHVQILLSHIAMDYCADGSGSVGARTASGNDQVGYYEWQALSTMDVDCPPWMDWFHGGLQFQMEHHLFPRLPRWKLRSLVPLVDEIFAKYGVPVMRESFYNANVLTLKQMRKVGLSVAKSAKLKSI